MTKPEKKVIVWAIIGGLVVIFIARNQRSEHDLVRIDTQGYGE